MSESINYICEICGGNHPTEEHESFEQEKQPLAEVGTSGYRIEKLNIEANGLSQKLEDYIELENSPYTRSKAFELEEAGGKINSSFFEIKQLLPRMEDFPLSDDDKDIILDLIDQIETLEKRWYEAKSKYQDTPGRATRIEDLRNVLDEKVQKFISGLEQLPADRLSVVKFESGHHTQLLSALNQDDIEASRDIILEIDKLLTDDYSSYPKKIVGDAALRFRLEQAIKEPENPKLVNTKKIELTKGSLVIRTSQDKVSISFEGLDPEQQRIWDKIE